MPRGREKSSVLQPRSGRHETAVRVPDDLSADAIAGVIQGHGEITTAVVDDISPDGVARVVLTGEEQPRNAASVLRFPSAAAASEALLGRTVLVLLNRPAQPVILGAVAQRLWDERDPDSPAEVQAKLPGGEPVAVQLDKRRIDLEASDEIRLTCGKSSLVMRRDGTVVVRGVTIVSRATQSNKIRGGTVSIN
jgi:hypothetical protein